MRLKILVPFCWFNTKNVAHPQRRIDPISDLTQIAHHRSPKALWNSCFQFRLMVEALD